MARASHAGEGQEDPPAPEGGWSWLIVAAISLSKMAFWGALPCFGLVFADVLQSAPGSEGASVASVLSVFTISLDCGGLCCPAFYRKFTFRQVGVAGGLIFLLGSVTASFATSVSQLIISYGFVQGLGFGLMMSANLAAFNEHFRRRRTVAMAVAQCANSAGGLALPLAAQALRAAAGERAAKLALAGVGAAAAASQLCLHSPRAPAPAPAPAPAEPLLRRDEADGGKVDKLNPNELSKMYGPKRAWWRRRLGAGRGAARRVWRGAGVDVALLRDPAVLLVAAGVSLVHVAEPNVFAMLPLHLRGGVALGEADAARVLTAANAGDFAGRLALVALGCWLARSNRLVFAAGAAASAAAVLALSFVTSWAAVLALSVVLGVFKGVLYVTFFLTLAEIVPTSKFPAAVALQFCLQIVCSMVISPILGLVRDATGSYPACFHVVAGLLCLSPLAWGLHAALRARRRRQRCSADDAESSKQPLELLPVGNDISTDKER